MSKGANLTASGFNALWSSSDDALATLLSTGHVSNLQRLTFPNWEELQTFIRVKEPAAELSLHTGEIDPYMPSEELITELLSF